MTANKTHQSNSARTEGSLPVGYGLCHPEAKPKDLGTELEFSLARGPDTSRRWDGEQAERTELTRICITSDIKTSSFKTLLFVRLSFLPAVLHEPVQKNGFAPSRNRRKSLF